VVSEEKKEKNIGEWDLKKKKKKKKRGVGFEKKKKTNSPRANER